MVAMDLGENPQRALLHRLRMALALFAALLFSSFAYRQRLLSVSHNPLLWADEPLDRAFFLRQLGSDAALCLSAAALLWLFALLGSSVSRSVWLRRVGLTGLSLLLFLLGMLLQAHFGTLLAMRSGLTLELLRESLDPIALRESISLLPASEFPYLFVPLLVFWVSFVVLQGRTWVRGTFVSLLGVATVVVFTWAARVPAPPLPSALLHHPLGFLATELALASRAPKVSLSFAHAATHEAMPPAQANTETASPDETETPEPAQNGDGSTLSRFQIALTDPQFVRPESKPEKRKFSSQAEPPQNVLLFILESTGAEYVSRPLPNGQWAMPFLKKLTEKGLHLANHYSAGNSSPRGIFSALSGLYVMPDSGIWDVRKDIYVPSLMSYLGSSYQHFLVTPASLDWYFPHHYLVHSGMTDLWGYHNLPTRKNSPGGAHARDETEAVSFFLQKLKTAAEKKQPFVGVYYSFLAHWPYPDYGPASHVVPPTKALHLYLNSLHYLDKQIERLYMQADALGLLENTVLVILGDHGEAFGQHPHNYTHSRASFDENYRTPALLLHPRLFPPQVITAPTSHVDVLPTLLEALGKSYDPERMQGESLFQTEFRRKYIFLYGNEETLSSVSADQIKLQVSVRDNTCWAFDLRKDPGEIKKLACAAYKEQHQALLAYRKHQQRALRNYNALSRAQGFQNLVLAKTTASKKK